MSDLEAHISRIKNKLQLLLKQYSALQKVNQQQAELIEQLKTENEANAHKLRSQREQILILKTNALQMGETEKKEMEKTINQYIREIDKCINFLSQ